MPRRVRDRGCSCCTGVWGLKQRARPARAVVPRKRGGRMSLRDVLEAVIGSAPFERLLLERSRPIVARAGAGEDALIAALAVALEAPLLMVAPGPREAEELAGGGGADLREEGGALLPGRGAPPYE